LKRLLPFIFCTLIFLTIPSLFAETTTHNLSIHQDEFQLTSQNDYLLVSSHNRFDVYPEQAGKPYLPLRMVNVLVPEDAEFVDLKFRSEKKEISKGRQVYPTQKLIPLSSEITPEFVLPNPEYYQDSYPDELVEYTSTQNLSKYRYFTFLISPFSYNSLTNSLELNSSISLEVEYTRTAPRLEQRRDDGTFAAMLNSEVINPGNLPNLSLRSPVDPDDVQYLIVTSSGLESSFQILADWKTATGVPAEVITTSEIYNSYTGATNQLKIKNCLLDYYQNRNTLWVLLGGDDTIVPDQDCFGDVNDGDITDDYMPTDLFYACFDNAFDWNADGDGIFGETTDNIDMAPEIIISRAPVRTTSHTTAFVQKTLEYIQNPPTADFADKMVISGLELWNTWDGRSDADRRCEIMWNDYIDPVWSGTRERFYDTNTDFGGSGYDVTAANISSVINDGYNYFFMATHGNQNLWSTESGNYFTSGSATYLTNQTRQGMVATMACITNAFDGSSGYSTDPCLSEAFIRNPNGGAVVYHGSSRYGWGYGNISDNHGPSIQYADYLFNYLFGGQPAANPYIFGAVATQTKIHFISASASYGAFRWLQFTLNSIGDPNLDLLTANPEEIAVSAPASIFINSANAMNISTGIQGAKVCLTNNQDVYIAGNADASGNFSCSVQTGVAAPIFVTVNAHNHAAGSTTIQVINLIPQLAVDHVSLTATLDPNESLVDNITITNSGQSGSILNYSLFLEGEEAAERFFIQEKVYRLKNDLADGKVLNKIDLALIHEYEKAEVINTYPNIKSKSRNTVTCYPQESNYWSGSVSSSAKTQTSEAKIYGGGESGWIKFDVSDIPEGSEINSILFNFYVNNTSWPYWSTTPVTLDPVTASAASLYSDINNEKESGYYNHQNEASGYPTGWKQLQLAGNAATDLFAKLEDGWFVVGMSSRDGGSSYYLEVDGWDETNKPYLEVDYTPNVPVLALTNPSGGELIPVGNSIDITWLHSGAELLNVDIFLSRDNGINWEQIVSNTSNDGSFQWLVESPASDNCLVKVSSPDGTVQSVSNSTFKIYLPVEWLSLSQNSGTVNYSQVNIIGLEFDSSGMINGEYLALLTVNSNGGSEQIPIIMNVTGLQFPEVETEFNNEGDLVSISWPVIEEATSYKVYSADSPYAEFPGEWTLEYSGTELSWQISSSDMCKFFRVVSCN